jgi:hypothetical protein
MGQRLEIPDFAEPGSARSRFSELLGALELGALGGIPVSPGTILWVLEREGLFAITAALERFEGRMLAAGLASEDANQRLRDYSREIFMPEFVLAMHRLLIPLGVWTLGLILEIAISYEVAGRLQGCFEESLSPFWAFVVVFLFVYSILLGPICWLKDSLHASAARRVGQRLIRKLGEIDKLMPLV